MKLETVLQVRAATSLDIPALLALERSAPAAAHWAEADYHRLFVEASGRAALLIEGDSVQGFIIARDLGLEWEIENIVVASSVRRRGRGMRLVQELLARARDHGAKAVFLEVRESNRAARALYSEAGFVESGRRKSYYQNPDEDAILYKKLLPRGAGKAVEGGTGV